MPVSWTYTNDNGTESVSLVGDGISTVVSGSHPKFGQLRDYLTATREDGAEPDPARLRELTDLAAQVAVTLGRLSERVSFDGANLLFDGDRVDNSLSRHIVRMIREGDEQYGRWVRFMENLAENPSLLSRLHLFTWLAGRDFAITPEGHLLGYKGVGGDGLSVSSGTASVNGTTHRGRIPNPVGAVVEMPRLSVNTDRGNGCSTGLHVGTFEYAAGFGQRLLLVSVNPRDVVSVPRDCGFQKMRVCRYTVLAAQDIAQPITVPSYGDDPVFPPDDCYDEDRCDECGELADGDGYDGLCGNCADRADAEGRWD